MIEWWSLTLVCILYYFITLKLQCLNVCEFSKVKELESTIEEHKNEISRMQDQLRMAKPSTLSESAFILCYVNVCNASDSNVAD